jgi:hypothetical protein
MITKDRLAVCVRKIYKDEKKAPTEIGAFFHNKGIYTEAIKTRNSQYLN